MGAALGRAKGPATDGAPSAVVPAVRTRGTKRRASDIKVVRASCVDGCHPHVVL
jgi:hypothetical protein